MRTYIKAVFAAMVLLAVAGSSAMAEEYVKGKIDDIAPDKTTITVAGTKISTDRNFVDDFFLIKGDEVEITARKTDNGLEATDCTFPYENLQSGGSGK